jgi:pre-rRNA-processing protein TSR3
MHILILRDPRESLARCSLTPLRGLPGIEFVDYHPERRLQACSRILLHAEGDEFGPADHDQDLLLIDCSWRRVGSLLRTVDGAPQRRRLPPLVSAYPRRSKTFPDPGNGLASVEALYAATLLLGHPRPELLRDYRWREAFLAANRQHLEAGTRL